MSQFYWKTSSIDNLTDARFFNALENAWIEFCFDALEKKAITIEKTKAIQEWLFEPQIVASFGLHQSAEEIHFILKECNIEYAAVSILHELVKEEDFLSIGFLKINISQLDLVNNLQKKPFAVEVSTNRVLTDIEVEKIKKIEKDSLVFLHLPTNIDLIKSQLIQFNKIGIEVPTSLEKNSELGAIEIYDLFIEILED